VRVDEHTISLDDSPAYYRSAEVSGMPTLYLHGIPTSSDDWLELLARTGGIAPDLIGFGRSAKGGHLDYSPAGLAGFVERLLDHLGVQDLQVVGHDWGARVGLKLAERNPGRVRRLVFLNPPPNREHWPRILKWWHARGLGELLMGAIPRRLFARELRRGAATRADAWPDARVDAVWDQFDQGTQRAILRLVRSAEDDVIGSGGPRPHVSAEGVATTVLWGEEDPWYPPETADAYAALLPGATVERIAGAGHWPWLDRPEVVDRVAALLEG
jgi:pimeloyl-ACP methyl ester carboxylesterase